MGWFVFPNTTQKSVLRCRLVQLKAGRLCTFGGFFVKELVDPYLFEKSWKHFVAEPAPNISAESVRFQVPSLLKCLKDYQITRLVITPTLLKACLLESQNLSFDPCQSVIKIKPFWVFLRFETRTCRSNLGGEERI